MAGSLRRRPHGPPYGDADNTEVTDIEIITIDGSRLSDFFTFSAANNWSRYDL